MVSNTLIMLSNPQLFKKKDYDKVLKVLFKGLTEEEKKQFYAGDIESNEQLMSKLKHNMYKLNDFNWDKIKIKARP